MEKSICFSNSTPGYLTKENENTNLKRYMHPMFIAALFTMAKIGKQHKVSSTDEWIKKMLYICVCVRIYIYVYIRTHTMEYYSTIKKNGILPFVTTQMDLEGITLSEISHRKRYCMISLICGI